MTKAEKINDSILVVDGDIITRTVISDFLRHCGYHVVEANDAQQVVGHDAFHVDIILCDIVLPGEISGFQLAAWIRENNPEIKIILSAADDRTASVAGDLCEEGPHLAKPYDPTVVVDHIKRLRGGHSITGGVGSNRTSPQLAKDSDPSHSTNE